MARLLLLGGRRWRPGASKGRRRRLSAGARSVHRAVSSRLPLGDPACEHGMPHLRAMRAVRYGRFVRSSGAGSREARALARPAASPRPAQRVRRRDRRERAGAAEDDRDHLLVAEHELPRVAAQPLAADVDAELLAFAGAVRAEAAGVEADAPDVEELAEREHL